MPPSLCSLLSFQLFVTFCLRGFSPHRWVWISLHLHQSFPHLLLSLESQGSASPCPFSMDPPCLSLSSWPLSLRPCLPSVFQFTCSCLSILSSVSVSLPSVSSDTLCLCPLSSPPGLPTIPNLPPQALQIPLLQVYLQRTGVAMVRIWYQSQQTVHCVLAT